ncbi:MAG: tetratricopeptide repeat protein [Bacteriovoracia bacterium]
MSVQKIIAEADKLLDRGKLPEAIEKLKFALQAEPTNQLATTKLANAYAAGGSKEKAAATFTALANRLSEVGKAQVAIAVYKQALELTPNDISLKLRFAQECESVGKVGDAQTQAQSVFQYYLRRKKYFDAANILPMLVRLNGKDDILKQAWLEVMLLSQAEKKLVHLLVALCGPPGIVSEEFSVGGEPAALSEPVFEGIKKLVAFFPRDPKIAYAAAWSAYRRGRFKDFFHFLRECLRREPDFCLGLLLFARVLAERERLNEAYFVFRLLKERLAADKSVEDISTLTQLVDAFVEKNGWIAFVEQTGDHMDASQFVDALRGQQATPPTPVVEQEPSLGAPPEKIPSQISITMPFIKPPPTPEVESADHASSFADGPELPPAEIELGSGDGDLEIQHLSEEKKSADPAVIAPAETTIVRPPEDVEGIPIADEATMVGQLSAPAEKTMAEPMQGTSATTVSPLSEYASAEGPPPESEVPPKSGFNPLEHMNAPAESPVLNADSERTVIFSPMEIIDATSRATGNYNDVKTKIIDPPPPAEPTSSTLPSRTMAIEPPAGAWHDLNLNGVETDIFSPMEIIQAQSDSQPNAVIDKSRYAGVEPKPAEAAADADGATQIMHAPPFPGEGSSSQGLMPIPEGGPTEAIAEADPGVDMGDDLLDGATRILLAPPKVNATQHLFKEIAQESKKEPAASDPAVMLRKAERFIAKRNYYLARKALRHAQVLGASDEVVRKRLGDIRKLELPESLYQAVSNDETGRERSSDILERLEKEFDIGEKTEVGEEIESSIDAKLEEIFRENDPRTIIDFGIGLHEMGLYRPAEKVFSRVVADYPDFSFDAYYLAAVSKFSRKDYAGAASILKKLSANADKSEQEKIQIYYALGELFAKMSQLDRSKEFFKKVAELDSNYRNIRHKLEE